MVWSFWSRGMLGVSGEEAPAVNVSGVEEPAVV